MKLGPGEPAVQQWTVITLQSLAERLLTPTSQPNRPQILAVDGRSGGGKSTLANRLHQLIPNSAVVHTDDVAWYHSFFGWDELMIEGVFKPVSNGKAIAYRPPAWDERKREGAITVPAGCTLVIVEGVGASRRELSPWLSASVWLQSDLDEAERRGLARDGGTEEAKRFWDEWMREEFVFLEQQAPWTRARCIVNGTPALTHNPATDVVVADAYNLS